MTMKMDRMKLTMIKMDKIKMATMTMDLVVLEGTLKLAPVAPSENHVRRPAEYLGRGCHGYDHVDHVVHDDRVDHNEMITMFIIIMMLTMTLRTSQGKPREKAPRNKE